MIRIAQPEELTRILQVYGAARTFMKENGNADQWGGHYPPQELLEDDIRRKHLYIYEDSENIHGVFAFIPGEDPTYSYIEDGAWKNDKPYGTVHRIASDGSVKGVFGKCLEYCRSFGTDIRIDTHKDNRVMQHLLTKYGFVRCGIIYLKNGASRIAYQYVAQVTV